MAQNKLFPSYDIQYSEPCLESDYTLEWVSSYDEFTQKVPDVSDALPKTTIFNTKNQTIQSQQRVSPTDSMSSSVSQFLKQHKGKFQNTSWQKKFHREIPIQKQIFKITRTRSHLFQKSRSSQNNQLQLQTQTNSEFKIGASKASNNENMCVSSNSQ